MGVVRPAAAALTPRAFAVLRHLVDHAGRLVTKEELLTKVWRDAIVSDAALASCIRDLRKALRDSSRGAPATSRRCTGGDSGSSGHCARDDAADPCGGPVRFGRGDRPGDPARALTTTPLVGRDAEVARLRERLDRGVDGPGSWSS